MTVIKDAIEFISDKAVLIGTLKPMIELFDSKDLMSAHLLINLNENKKHSSEIVRTFKIYS